MKKRTLIAEELDAAGIKVQYDEHVKRILSSRQVLARILQGAAAEYADFDVEEIEEWIEPGIEVARVPLKPGVKRGNELLITGNNTESVVPGEGRITFDIRFCAMLPRHKNMTMVKLLLNVEAQKKFYQKYRIVTRGIFYGARMLSEQLDREFKDSDYDSLKKVYSIWICMNAPNHIGNAMSEYRISKRDLIGRIPERKASYDKLSVIVICLNEKAPAGNSGKLHGFLNTLLSPDMDAAQKERILEEDYGLAMEQELEKELKQMCNLSEAIEEKALEKGLKKGIKQGFSRGKAQGIAKGKTQGISQGIRLTKRVLRLAGEGLSESDIAAACAVTMRQVHEILAD